MVCAAAMVLVAIVGWWVLDRPQRRQRRRRSLDALAQAGVTSPEVWTRLK
jgi:peptidoglycan/LPS O-acetylase OafA/YrhL